MTFAFNMQKGIQNDVAVIDFAKAFDKVAQNRSLYKLPSYEVKGNTLGWIGSFLSGRSISKCCPTREIIFCSCAFRRPAGLSFGPCITSQLSKSPS